MPKKAAGLSARAVQTMREPGLFADGNGLYLQISKTGAKSWVFRYQIAGRRRDMGLGSLSVFGLSEARQKAAAARRMVAEGIDPLDAREAERAAAAVVAPTVATFRQCAESFIETNKAGWSNPKHAAQWSATLEAYAFPMMGDLPINVVSTEHVLSILTPIWATKTETASRLRGRIESVLDFAKVKGLREGENPARWKGHLDHILPAKSKVASVEHHASLPYAEMPAFWPRLQVQDGTGARALELAVLTACRSGEVLGATWAEIDMDGAVWIIPAGRMKAGQEHRVPLTAPALALLRKMAAIRMGEFVFPGQAKSKPLSNMSMAMVLRRMKVDATPHGFRSTFRTWAAEKANYPHEICEAALAHTQGDKVVAAYQRGDFFEKRRRLMEEWAEFIERGAPRLNGGAEKMKGD